MLWPGCHSSAAMNRCILHHLPSAVWGVFEKTSVNNSAQSEKTVREFLLSNSRLSSKNAAHQCIRCIRKYGICFLYCIVPVCTVYIFLRIEFSSKRFWKKVFLQTVWTIRLTFFPRPGDRVYMAADVRTGPWRIRAHWATARSETDASENWSM